MCSKTHDSRIVASKFLPCFRFTSRSSSHAKNRNQMPCFGHMWSIRYRSTMRHKLANRMAQQARILTITNIKYRWKPPAASLDSRYRKREHSTSSRKFNCNKSEQFFGVNGDERLCAFLASFEIRYLWNFDTRSFFFWMFSRYFAIYPVLYPIVWQLHTSDSWPLLLTSCS